MSSIHQSIRSALEDRLNTLSNVVGATFPVVYENVPYSPTTGTTYVTSKLVHTNRRRSARGPNASIRYQGFMYLEVYAPENAGPAAAENLVETIIDSFESNTNVTYTTSGGTTLTVSIDYAERDQGFLDTPWYYIPIRIGWYIYN
tara:strand:+ start:9749 stop:10183 length:435 start_codon:yes stop_codon:yes gene_type:complete